MTILHYGLCLLVLAGTITQVRNDYPELKEILSEIRVERQLRKELKNYEKFLREYGSFISSCDFESVTEKAEKLREFLN